ncbi:hypothetical protein COEREDRAFT_6401 [Coemansia reversa NRRL 1564]|uniref:Uncharacterized protein n=1 Tax=Coemansia reversa (strain ATCC 12441 / NRRL 1564) TaxID=763665 RepID=A0A2G5BI96_COERN|nr:hypothetical protein COEREDRAFT_6401 [Coemansia reversa NRRL 1564]|eukprot:PIA18692.1 hypothetical protein COEREDRAFT_6401 [Coemansia reversa NRRL 1564]
MRRAYGHVSWTDSMASSITLTGSRSVAVRQYGGNRSVRPYPRTGEPDQILRRLVQDLNASRIDEETEEDLLRENTDGYTDNIFQTTVTLSSNPERDSNGVPDTATSRRKKVAHIIKTKSLRLLRLIAYYLRRLIQDYTATASMYRPLQYRLY